MKTVFFALLVSSASAHLFFNDPPPRSCFYGGSGSDTDGDGAWRRFPCDRVAIDPVTTYVQGQKVCMDVQEFVDHPGYFKVQLAEKAVNPDDDDTQIDWITLIDNQEDTQNGTAHQAFFIEIPQNVTCDHCTIQVQQWAEDFQWYYYACSDVKIVAPGDAGADVDTTDDDQSTCVWREGPAMLRFKILQTALYGIVIIVGIVFLLGWAWHYNRKAKADNVEGSCVDRLKERWSDGRSKKVLTMCCGPVFVVALIAVFITLSVLSSC